MEPDEEQSPVVTRIFHLLTKEHLSVRNIARRLSTEGVPTAKGAIQWHPSTVDRILRNPVYKGSFYYHKLETGLANDPLRPRAGSRIRPPEEWIEVKVPSIVDDAM
ncbi:MAG: recombinase family protein [Chloroflexi bacterium]|nr:recombinase family protein [Chloroflexota bacterium]